MIRYSNQKTGIHQLIERNNRLDQGWLRCCLLAVEERVVRELLSLASPSFDNHQSSFRRKDQVMPWKICFDLPAPIGRICINIPVLIRKFPDEIGPWITKDVLDQKLVKDLPVLATIDMLASQLTDASVKRAVQSAIQGGVKQKSLKGNTTIQFS